MRAPVPLTVSAATRREARRFKSCETALQACWWSIPEDRRERESEWQVRIRLAYGTVGWTTKVKTLLGSNTYD